jgi:hypothetical protein
MALWWKETPTKGPPTSILASPVKLTGSLDESILFGEEQEVKVEVKIEVKIKIKIEPRERFDPFFTEDF